jgi:hypothetical protein
MLESGAERGKGRGDLNASGRPGRGGFRKLRRADEHGAYLGTGALKLAKGHALRSAGGGRRNKKGALQKLPFLEAERGRPRFGRLKGVRHVLKRLGSQGR